MCDSSIHLEATVSARVVHISRDDQLKNLTKHCVHGTVQYFRYVHTELTNQVEFLFWWVVLPSARAQYTSLTNPKWRPLTRYHAARQTRLWPLPAKNFRTVIRWFRVSGTSKRTNFQPGENSSSAIWREPEQQQQNTCLIRLTWGSVDSLRFSFL